MLTATGLKFSQVCWSSQGAFIVWKSWTLTQRFILFCTDDKDFETIIKEQIVSKGIAHIQSGDVDEVSSKQNCTVHVLEETSTPALMLTLCTYNLGIS
jgi:hypothetical protein